MAERSGRRWQCNSCGHVTSAAPAGFTACGCPPGTYYLLDDGAGGEGVEGS